MKTLLVFGLILLFFIFGCAFTDNAYTPGQTEYGSCIRACTGGYFGNFDKCQPKCIELATNDENTSKAEVYN